MGVESKIRELMEGAANRPKDNLSAHEASNPTQGDSNPNPEKQDLSGSDDKGGLTSSVGKAAAAKASKDNTLPNGNGAGAAPNFTDAQDPKSVVNQATSAGVREEVEEVEEEVIEEDFEEVTEEEVAVEDDVLFEEDLAALFAGDENLTEEFKTKAAEIFEAVVTSRVANEVQAIEADLEEQANAEYEARVEEMVENIDKYLSYVTEQWMTQNELAIENGLRNEITESFIKGMQQVFTEHYIEVPEEKYDVLSEMQAKIDDLQEKLDEQIESNMNLTEESVFLKKQNIISEIAEGLADTEAERFITLVEDIAYTDAESYTSKLTIVKENYFPKEKVATDSVLEDTVDSIDENTNSIMSKYAQAIAKSTKF
jgi:hypothetical protein